MGIILQDAKEWRLINGAELTLPSLCRSPAIHQSSKRLKDWTGDREREREYNVKTKK